jgi:hypothetical protein
MNFIVGRIFVRPYLRGLRFSIGKRDQPTSEAASNVLMAMC